MKKPGGADVTVRIEDYGRGPRIVVPRGGADHVLTIEEATELRDDLTRALATATAKQIADGRIAPGVIVEWDLRCGGTVRAKVHRIEDWRVYVRMTRRPTKTNPKSYRELHFDPHEVGLLRVIP